MEYIIEVLKVLSPLAVAVAAIGIKNTSVAKKFDKFALNNTLDHNKIFAMINKHETIMGQYTENGAFFQQVENIAGTACEYVDDDEAHKYASIMSGSIIEFAKDVLNITIDKITDIQVDAKFFISIEKSKQAFNNIWEEYTKDYFSKYAFENETYIKRVKAISEDKVNSKSDRFRAETVLYMHTLMKNFILYYHKELM